MKKVGAVIGALMITALSCVSAFASEGSTQAGNLDSGMTGAITSAFDTVKSDIISIIVIALPVALGIMGLTLAIKKGIQFFKTSTRG